MTTLQTHRRRQLKKNAAVREAMGLVNKALAILDRHDMLGLIFTRRSDGKTVSLRLTMAKPRYVPPPRVKIDRKNPPKELDIDTWTHTTAGGSRYTRPAPGGGTWTLRHWFTLRLERDAGNGRPAFQVGGAFLSFTGALRRAYEVDCAEMAAKAKKGRRAT
jgi:hypothetical protein